MFCKDLLCSLVLPGKQHCASASSHSCASHIPNRFESIPIVTVHWNPTWYFSTDANLLYNWFLKTFLNPWFPVLKTWSLALASQEYKSTQLWRTGLDWTGRTEADYAHEQTFWSIFPLRFLSLCTARVLYLTRDDSLSVLIVQHFWFRGTSRATSTASGMPGCRDVSNRHNCVVFISHVPWKRSPTIASRMCSCRSSIL